MANQSPDRRQVLEMLAKISVVGQFPGFVRWVCAAEHTMPSPARTQPAKYQLQFFNPAEYATVDQLSELIIPADETPGAKAAGVSEFIDFMAANDPDIQRLFRDGLAWLDQYATGKRGQAFIRLPEDQQIELLRGITDQAFFKLVRKYTVMGYYTSRIGLEQLGYPGLKLYTHSPACPHKGDPEHKHLPLPRT